MCRNFIFGLSVEYRNRDVSPVPEKIEAERDNMSASEHSWDAIVKWVALLGGDPLRNLPDLRLLLTVCTTLWLRLCQTLLIILLCLYATVDSLAIALSTSCVDLVHHVYEVIICRRSGPNPVCWENCRLQSH